MRKLIEPALVSPGGVTEGAGEPVGQVGFCGGARAREWLPGGCGREPVAHGGAGALERTGGRVLAAVEDAGYLAGGKPTTSRRMRAARCRGGRTCKAVMKASEMASVASYLASGPGAASVV